MADVPDLRPLRDTDVADVLMLNERNVVKLAPMDEAKLHVYREEADRSTCSTWRARSRAS